MTGSATAQPVGQPPEPTGQSVHWAAQVSTGSREHNRNRCGRMQKLEITEENKINSIHLDIS